MSRVPETSTAAQAMVQERLQAADAWAHSADGTRHWWSRVQSNLDLAHGLAQGARQGPVRWIVVRTQEGEERARASVQRQADRDQASWAKRLWHRQKTFTVSGGES